MPQVTMYTLLTRPRYSSGQSSWMIVPLRVM